MNPRLGKLIKSVLFYVNMREFDLDEFKELILYLDFDIGFDLELMETELMILWTFHSDFVNFFEKMSIGEVDIPFLNELDQETRPKTTQPMKFVESDDNWMPMANNSLSSYSVYHIVAKILVSIFESRQGGVFELVRRCKWCGDFFIPKNRRAVFCCSSHRASDYQKNKKRRNKEINNLIK